MTGPAHPGSPLPPGTAGPGDMPYRVSRLSPRVLLINPIRMLPSLLFPLLGLLVASGFSPASFGWAGLGVALSVLYTVVRWATFSYRLTGDRLELIRVFITRSVRAIPLERVRGVDVTASPLHRLLGLAVVKIDTGAAGRGEEGTLDAVTVREAAFLRAVLLARQPAATPFAGQGSARAPVTPGVGVPFPASRFPEGPSTGDPVPGVPSTHPAQPGTGRSERIHARPPRRWLLLGPLSGAYLLTPFALVAGLFGLLLEWRETVGLPSGTALRAAEWVWDRPELIAGAATVLVLTMPLFGAITYAIFNWNFTVRSRDGYLIAERGLLTRRAVSLELARIRGYELVQGLFERWAGVGRLWALVTGLGDSETRGQMLPVTPRQYAMRVATEVVGPFDAQLRTHPVAALRRRLFRAVAPWLALGVVVYLLGWTTLALLTVVLAVLGVVLGVDRYRGLGHGCDGIRLSVRSGSLRRTQTVVERRAVVGWTLRQTIFQRMAGVLTVVAGVGAGAGGYAAVDTGEAQGVAFAAEVTPEWVRPFLADSRKEPA